jgi:23S rRNA (guanosine2251-2'-O)-methyltransferase
MADRSSRRPTRAAPSDARQPRSPRDAGSGQRPPGGRPGARTGGRPPQRDVVEHSPPADGRMVVYGRNPVREALQGPRKVARVWATAQAAKEPWLTHGQVTITDAQAVERACGSSDHQGICADVSPYVYADATTLLAVPDALIVALDEIQDPQNLGAICRTAECAGATGLVIPERRTAEVTPSVCKASAGAVEHLPIARVRNLADFLVEAGRAGTWSYGADGDARTRHTTPDYRGPVVLVLGSEGRGLRPRVAKSCDALVALPLHGKIASLNVNAAAAALLYEIVRQRSVG